MRSSLSNSLLLNRTNWTQCQKVSNAGIHLLGHNLYHLHLCDDYTFPSKLLIKVLSNAEPRIASYATSAQNLQHSSASSSKTEISNLECAKPTDGPHAPSKEQPKHNYSSALLLSSAVRERLLQKVRTYCHTWAQFPTVKREADM